MKQVMLLSLCLFCVLAQAQAHDNYKNIELASLIKQLMESQDKSNNADRYLEMKAIFGRLRSAGPKDIDRDAYAIFSKNAEDFFYIFVGSISVTVKGKPLAMDRMQDYTSWKVVVAGPKATVSNVWLESAYSTTAKAGPSYFRSQGLTLIPIACAGRVGNYKALYRVTAPSKKPLLLGISSSAGSGGTWYSYQVSWAGLELSELAKDAQVGLCEVED